MNHIYDLLILGGGCAGLSAAIYAARDKLDTILLEKSHPGGQAVNTEEIVNYPGIRHITGPALMREMHLQAMDFGAEYRQAEAVFRGFFRNCQSGSHHGRNLPKPRGDSCHRSVSQKNRISRRRRLHRKRNFRPRELHFVSWRANFCVGRWLCGSGRSHVFNSFRQTSDHCGAGR